MAQKIIHQLVDDIDGSVLDVDAGETVRFSVDGTAYEIDLSDENAAKLREVFAPYLKAGRRLGSGRKPASVRRRSNGEGEQEKIREWAKAEGLKVADRGRISREIEQAYAAR